MRSSTRSAMGPNCLCSDCSRSRRKSDMDEGRARHGQGRDWRLTGAKADKALDHVVSDDSRQGADLGPCRCAGHAPPPGGAQRSGVWTRFSPPPKKPSPKKRSTPRKKVTSPRTEDHHLGALFDACGPGTSPRVSPRASPRPSLDGDDDEQALFDAIIVDDESSPRASPRASPMPSPRLPPPTQSTTPHLASSGFNFDARPRPARASLLPARSVRLRRRLPGSTRWRGVRGQVAVRRLAGRPGRGGVDEFRYSLFTMVCATSLVFMAPIVHGD